MEQISINWSNHHSHQTGVISKILFSHQFSDCVLVAEGCHVYAHKLVMAAASPYFCELFNSRPSFAYEIHGITFEGLCHFVQFVYTGDTQVNRAHVQDFLQICTQFQISGVGEFSVTAAAVAPPAELAASPRGSVTPRAKRRMSFRKCHNCYKTFYSLKRCKDHEMVCRNKHARRRLNFDQLEPMDVD
jgi:hypothetical protein